ncbi:hypothetical protein BDR07DRAFT_1484226 [Suillus spraguei]|nr:hypothetical protein BDR07DRAFT_1484226 [Suillus spraguei]
MSLSERFSVRTRSQFFQASAYLHLLREGFFDEVREKFYRPTDQHPGQQIPSSNKMSRQWISNILFSWSQAIYHQKKISPPDSTWSPPTQSEIDPTPTIKLDWASWSLSSQIDPVVQSLYGLMPDKTREPVDWLTMEEEARMSGNPLSPIVETDEASWRRCLMITLETLEIRIKEAQARSAAEAREQPSMEAEPPTPTGPDTQPSVAASSKRPASSTLANTQKPKKAKITQKETSSNPSRKPIRAKGKQKETSFNPTSKPNRSTAVVSMSARPSGSGSQFSTTGTTGFEPERS